METGHQNGNIPWSSTLMPTDLDETPTNGHGEGDILFDNDEWMNDPDILNNPEKLMRLRWTERDMELAASCQLIQGIKIIRELVLQDRRFLDTVGPSKGGLIEEKAASEAVMDAVIDKLTKETVQCKQIYEEIKHKKPGNSKDKHLLEVPNNADIQKQVKEVNAFCETYEIALTLRKSRKSVMPRAEDHNPPQLIDDVLELSKALEGFPKLIDAMLNISMWVLGDRSI